MAIRKWNDTEIDSAFYLQMQDLTTVLTGEPSFTFMYSYGSFVDIINGELTGSSLWDLPHKTIREAGYKTDLLLRALGTIRESNMDEMKQYFTELSETGLPKFQTQLITCLEDLRLQNIIEMKRPGTKRDFNIRKKYLKHYFYTQMKTNVVRGFKLDELFCLIYLRLHADEPDPDFTMANQEQRDQLEKLQSSLFDVFSARNTKDITIIANTIVRKLENSYKDMLQDYFTFPIIHLNEFTKSTLFDELTRTDPLANEDEESPKEVDNEYFDQSFSTWHRENENSDRKQNMLQFELDVGTKTSLMGGEARPTEDGDQAMASIQGTSGKSEGNDYSEQEALTKKQDDQRGKSDSSAYGRENKYAAALVIRASKPNDGEIELYKGFAEDIDIYRRKLAATIEKTIEHKQNAPHHKMHYGRLSKKILPLFTEDNPRIFYKKSAESNEVDAVFTLLVDCSASMHNKMNETKRGIVLFHEVLDGLRIPHAIVGFWEDTSEGSETYQPNYFHYVHQFEDRIDKNAGAKIMQLEAEEDNRDGFSIRKMTEELARRREKNKFLLVFTDGEPAALNYDENGIVDTNVAVAEARKKGIDVIGMFLADGEISEREEKTMKNIYGREHLMIPSVGELPDHFAPLLKKLLLRGI